MQVQLGEKLLFAGERKFNHLTIPLKSYSISSCKCCKDKLNLDYARAGPPSHRRRGACLLFILPPRLRFKSLRLASTVYSTYGIWYPFKLSACLGMMSFRHCVKWKGGGSPQLQYHYCLGTSSHVTPQGSHQHANAFGGKCRVQTGGQFYFFAN